MSPRAASWLAWSLAGLSVAIFLASVALHVLARSTQEVPSGGTSGALLDLLLYVPFLAFPLVGALVASRRPRNPIGWICLAVGLMWMLIAVGDQYEVYARAVFGSVPGTVTLDALTQWMWIPPVGLLGIYMILLFPDGRLPSRRWRPLAWLAGAVMVLASLGITIAPGPLEGHPGVRNPFGLEGHPWISDAGIGIILLLPLCMLASAVSLVLRYRRSRGDERQQIKWIAFAASFVGMVYLITMVSSFIVPSGAAWFAGSTPLWLELLQYAALISLTAVPIAVGFAVLKYRLYEIDLLINRALVYGSLTVMLALVYFGGVAATQAIFRTLTGQEEQPQIAIVVSTLVIAALFTPLRRRNQALVDRRFYRRKYDARKTLDAFSTRLRDETDLEALNSELVGVVRETMQPKHLSLWLRPDTPLKGKQAD
jgi:fumarate reductase subunit D